MSRKRSWVWNYAKVTGENNEMQCSLCEARMSYRSSPSAIANHLKALHNLQSKDNVTCNIAEDIETSSDSPNSENTEPPRKKRNTSKTLQNIFPVRQESITQAIAKFISTSMLPVSIVSLESFRDFMEVLEPAYKVPCEQTIRSRLQVIYNKIRSVIEKKLPVASSVSLATDEWSSRAKDRYMSVEVQTLDDNCCLQHFTLCNEAIEERPTAINIAEGLNSVIIDWDLMGKVQAVVHDSARVMELAGDLAETENSISCTAHLIQLVVKDSMAAVPQYEVVSKKGAKVVGHFHHSDVAIGALSKRQEQLQMKKERLVQSCPTRWDSTFHMCQSLLRNRSAIELVLGDRQVTTAAISKTLEILEEEWSIMENMVEVLKPFQIATTVLCSEKKITLSLVRPIIHGLKTKHMTERATDDNYVESFKSEAISSLDKRFNKSTNLTPQQISCFLDPRYKSLSHEDESTRTRIITFVKNIVLENPSVQETAVDKTSETAMDFLFQSNSISSNNWKAQYERYIAEPQITHNFDPLLWWKHHKDTFPLVFKVAQKYLSIPATSAMSERSFSTAGNIVTPKRSCLKPENVNLLTFIYQNRDILKEVSS